MENNTSVFFALVAVMFAALGCATDSILFFTLAAVGILYAWASYETEENNDD